MAELEKLKRDYAELVVRSGINIKKGQRLVITCDVENADFARLCAEVAYDAGCREVIMYWSDDVLKRMKYLRAADDVFDKVDSWYVDFRNTLAEEGAGFLHIISEDPELMNDRLALTKATMITLKRALELIGVSAPEKM